MWKDVPVVFLEAGRNFLLQSQARQIQLHGAVGILAVQGISQASNDL